MPSIRLPGLSALALASLAVMGCSDAPPAPAGEAVLAHLAAAPGARLPGLQEAASVVRDSDGIAHLRARNEHDLFFLQGWVHAQDRLFQLDVTRRRASGTLAELLGPGALPGDVQLRTFGLRRAAARTLPLLQPSTVAALEAYAEGVNAWADGHPLPPEYAALELTRFAPWTALDSLACGKLIAFGLAFDLGDLDRTVALQSYLAALGPQAGAALFSQDLFRSAPFDPASTVPDAQQAAGHHGHGHGHAAVAPRRMAAQAEAAARRLHPRTLELAADALAAARADPFLARLADRDDRDGSNQWVVSGRLTRHGAPLLANDPHLALGTPSTFYPIHLSAGRFDVVGNSFPGVPAVVIGHNRHLAWGATVDSFDVTDVYQEQLVADATSPSGLATVYLGQQEAVLPIPEAYSVNLVGDTVMDDVVPAPANPAIPSATLIVPRHNLAPLIRVDLAAGVGLSVAYTGSAGSREVETFLGFDRAEGLADFVEALRLFDVGSQNFCYADDRGRIAYFTNSAVPVREDLQAGAVDGAPPWLVRDGTGGNEWLPVQHPQPRQAMPFEVVPLAEMPRTIDPPAGFAVNANNDPDGLTLGNDPLARPRPGGGLLYLAPGFDAGFRAGRITQRLRDAVARGRVTFEQMQSIQADVRLRDAEALVPFVTAALDHARRGGAPAALAALGADPAVGEAVGRLAAWDQTTPTGLPEGYDAADVDGQRAPPGQAEIDASVAATIYAAWRGQVLRSVIDARLAGLPTPPGQQAMTALRHLLDGFAVSHGVGASGVDFFAVPGLDASPEDRRDLLLLQAVSDAVALLASPAFDAAFHGSTDMADWRWGKLHRIVLAHPMGGPFSVPPAFGQFPAPLDGLPGLPVDGGFGVPDASNHDPRAASVNDFMFSSGPSNRMVTELSRGPHKRSESVWPGGVSAVPGTSGFLNLLPLWLTNDTVPLRFTTDELARDSATVERFTP